MAGPDDPDDESKKSKPKPKTEADRGGSGRPPKKTALGYGGDESPVYKPGQLLRCRIDRAEPGGYSVSIVASPGSDIQPTSLPKQFHFGFLPSKERLSPGTEVVGRFVCLHNQRILLSQEKIFTQRELVGGDNDVSSSESNVQAFDSENFAPFRYKRAVDLILPPFQNDSLKEFKIGDYDLDWLISDVKAVDELLRNDVRASLEANILPNEMTGSKLRLGFSLSQIRRDSK